MVTGISHPDPGQEIRADRSSLRRKRYSELQLHAELNDTRLRTESARGNYSESRRAERCAGGTESLRIGQVKSLGAELKLILLAQREVLEEGEVDVNGAVAGDVR